MAAGGGRTTKASWVAAAAMVFAASAASGLALNASEDGENAASSPGNGVPLSAHALLRVVTEFAIKLDNSRSIEDIASLC